MKSDFHFTCSICGTRYEASPIIYDCPLDGGNLDLIPDYAAIQAAHRPQDILDRPAQSLWHYLALLPVNLPPERNTPLGAAGGTPLYRPVGLAQARGLKSLWVKDESSNPTASFKDRASAVVVARAREIGAEIIVTASSGNAGAALAGMSAAVGQKSVIFVPAAAPAAKIAQLLVFGAQVILVDGNYDSAFDLALQAADHFGWYCRNTGYNPFTTEGKKTAAFEIWHQLWSQAPANGFDPERRLTVLVSVGDGNIITGIHKGFHDLVELGWLERVPRIIGVQAEGSAGGAQCLPRSSGRPP